jgi:glycosyltransferase involved in cell wall biosynthesis
MKPPLSVDSLLDSSETHLLALTKVETRLKVLFIIPTLASGGSERVFSILANHLDSQKFDIIVAVLDGSHRFYDINAHQVRLIDFKISRVRQAFFKIIQLIRHEKPDLVVSTLSHLNQFIAFIRPLLLRKTRVIARESTIMSIVNKQESMTFLRNWLVRRLYPSFDALICQSIVMADDFKKYNIPSSHLTIINNPVDTAGILKLANLAVIPPKKAAFRFVSVGRLSFEKGIDKALSILAQLKNCDFEYHIIGEGNERDKLEKLTETLGLSKNVSFQGVQKNPFGWIASADLLLLTSEFEGFPNVLLEAGAVGTPSIAFACGGVVQEIITDGLNGFIVPDADEAAFAAAILRGLSIFFDRHKIRCLTEEKFGLEKIVKQYESAFLNV